MNLRNISWIAAIVTVVIVLMAFQSITNTRSVEATGCGLSNSLEVAATGTTAELSWNYNLSSDCVLTDFVILRWNLGVSPARTRVARVGDSKRSDDDGRLHYSDSGLEPNTEYTYRIKTKHTPPLRTRKVSVTTGSLSDNPLPTPTPAPTPTPPPTPTPTPVPDPIMDDFDCLVRITDPLEGYTRGTFEKCRIRHNHGGHTFHEHQILLGYTTSTNAGGSFQEARHFEGDGSMMSPFVMDEYYAEVPSHGYRVRKRNPNFHAHHKTGMNAQNLWDTAVFDQYVPGAPSSLSTPNPQLLPSSNPIQPDSDFACLHDSLAERTHRHTDGDCYHVRDGGE